MAQFLDWLPNSPIVAFTILLLVSVAIPPWFERLRLPGLVGLLAAGILLGPYGLQLLDPQSETIKLLSDIGKIYLMFVAGLEIDLVLFRQQKYRSFSFGLSTFIVPLITGTIIGLAFGFGWNASILIGSLLASHTLLAYPIAQRFGLVETESVVVTIGATIFTDISALFVLAICVAINAGEFSLLSLFFKLAALALYSLVVLFGFAKFGKLYFRRAGAEEGNQFLFVLLVVFVAAVGAQLIDIEAIVGAFLAGLAVNEVVGDSPVKEKVEFVGSVLFIPFFFIGMGLLLNIPVFIATLSTSFGLTLAIVLGLIGSKFVAAWVIQRIYGYTWPETLMMWSLSLPQVAATLAAALVGLQVGLLSEAVFNSVVVLMLVTSVVGPMLTLKAAQRLLPPSLTLAPRQSLLWWESRAATATERPFQFTAIVPVSNPDTEANLIAVAALLARHESGVIMPLSVATQAQIHLDEPELQLALQQNRQLLARSRELGETYNVKTQPILRIDSDVATGIARAACEQEASLIIMGWSEVQGLRSRLFGTLIDSVFWASHCPVAVMRLQCDPCYIERILVPVKDLSNPAARAARFAQLLADSNQSTVTLLHICPATTPPAQIAALEAEFGQINDGKAEIKIVASDYVAESILMLAREVDLLVLRSQRRRTAGGLAVSDVTTQVMGEVTCSVVLFGEPHT
jgi:Kef-type K+ transport system membrane component KefB